MACHLELRLPRSKRRAGGRALARAPRSGADISGSGWEEGRQAGSQAGKARQHLAIKKPIEVERAQGNEGAASLRAVEAISVN